MQNLKPSYMYRTFNVYSRIKNFVWFHQIFIFRYFMWTGNISWNNCNNFLQCRPKNVWNDCIIFSCTTEIIYLQVYLLFSAINANGRDLTVDFPQQSHWTGVIDEMEIVPSSHPGIGYSISSHQFNVVENAIGASFMRVCVCQHICLPFCLWAVSIFTMYF